MDNKPFYIKIFKKIKNFSFNLNVNFKLGKKSNQILEKELSVNKIRKFKLNFERDILPNSVINNKPNKLYDQNLEPIIKFKFYDYFNLKLEKDILPNSITHLTFGYYFNQNLEKDVLPNLITYLKFGEYFDMDIKKDVLPISIKYLIYVNVNPPDPPNGSIIVGTRPSFNVGLTFFIIKLVI